MGYKRYKRRWSREEWEATLEEYRKSGKNKSEFCKQKGINRSYFYVWYDFIAEVSKKSEEKGKFIPISVIEKEASEDCKRVAEKKREIESRIQIWRKDGISIELKEGCKISELKRIVGVLDAST